MKNKRVLIILVFIFLIAVLYLWLFLFGENVGEDSDMIPKNSKERNILIKQTALPETTISENETESFSEKKQPADEEAATSTLKKTETNSELESVLLKGVPFTPQAPFAEWSNPMFQDGCEEASIIMAMRWVSGNGLTKEQAKAEIRTLSEFQLEYDGTYIDRSASSTAQLIKDYYNYQKVAVEFDINLEDIKKELLVGNLVIVPVDGTKLDNPYYTPPGPDRHMMVIIGYENEKDQFITNDSGTRRGEKYSYNTKVLANSIRDYPTGDHLPIKEQRTAMIVVEKN